MAEFLLIVWTVLVFFLCGRDLLHPSFMLALIWAIGIEVCNLSDLYYPLQPQTTATMVFFIILSSAAGVLPRLALVRFSRRQWLPEASYGERGERILKFLMGISIVGCMWFVAKFLHEMLAYESIAHYFYYARVADMNGEPLVTLNYLEWQIPPLAFATSLCVLYEYAKPSLDVKRRRSDWLWAVALFLSTGMSLCITGTRSVLIVYLLMLILTYMGQRRPSLKNIFIALFLFCMFYAATVYFMRATESDKESKSMWQIMEKHFVLYSTGGIKGFEGYLLGNVEVNHPPIAVLLGEEPTGQMEMIDLGPELQGNVFSAYAVYLYYFGTLAPMVTIIIFLLVGCLHEIRNASMLTFLFSCFASTAAALTVFHDYFFTLFPYMGRVTLLYLFLYACSRIRFVRYGMGR